MKRLCAVCGAKLTPHSEDTLTAHEFMCYKRKPELVPEHHRARQAETLAWEKRSAAAKGRKKRH